MTSLLKFFSIPVLSLRCEVLGVQSGSGLHHIITLLHIEYKYLSDQSESFVSRDDLTSKYLALLPALTIAVRSIDKFENVYLSG